MSFGGYQYWTSVPTCIRLDFDICESHNIVRQEVYGEACQLPVELADIYIRVSENVR